MYGVNFKSVTDPHYSN